MKSSFKERKLITTSRLLLKIFPRQKCVKLMNEALFILKKGVTKVFHLESEYVTSY